MSSDSLCQHDIMLLALQMKETMPSIENCADGRQKVIFKFKAR
jgi:hypothetical protein